MEVHAIKDGVVVNTIVASVPEAQAAFPDCLCVDASLGGAIGWSYDGHAFTPPPPIPAPVPEQITMRQCRLQLLAGGLLDDVDAAIAAIEDPAQRRTAQIEWEYAATVERGSAWVKNLATALGLTSEQLDGLFVEAAKL